MFTFFSNFLRPFSAMASSSGTTLASATPSASNLQFATVAGGCFWGMEKYFCQEFGNKITNSMVGYTGGKTVNPSYRDVCTGSTGHAEAVRFEYDPRVIAYDDILRLFFSLHNPTTPNRQGNDVGSQYRSAIFYHSEEQRVIAERVKAEIQQQHYANNPIVTEIIPATDFYRAEEYHQRYLDKNPGGYCNHYRRW